ncbi:TPA: LysR family transcriptional regulator ArgP [Stenotrophomonas maltophilia]|uniref:LysR family transcriptional regulator ArgP n=1 Tax=Stenotrophomonas TaxID=40323 RepID=UPI001311E7F9|nr:MULTISPECIES: LysR family transcriptional regulator ArgP [Stenotrophomonas]MBH1590866.1 LysR family transcriptional regulator ArgP [Stenotrophomonas maltophilia]MDH2021713.1 LysR family transcriptional regulator ArgP [Stenotrophomonas sp. GD03680]HDS1321630.1 LysR family transcriptional regulator ArgP [Stenotrophomonas maltophilia]HDS1326239.1 LysR family transcriptional regulator ArgP [Stenotrophomonas maltophilia]HDS1330945.1 LysR family transcriptional regulator ArgP [Stenotrophomonas ma
MDLIHPQLAAFSAALDEGGFDAAARRLSITPSAVSQRIKSLEDRLGQVLLVRQVPCRPTPAGQRLLQRLQPMKVLEAEALADLHPERAGPFFSIAVAIAVNDDSLQTWVLDALAELHREHGYLFDVRVDDQDHTLALLQDGAVLGAVTSQATPLKGCSVVPLGSMRYRAIASSAFVKTYFPSCVDAISLSKAPMLIFNRKDELQWRFLRRITKARLNPPVHYLPSSTGFVDAARLGLGWCLAPEALIKQAVAAKHIVTLDQDRPVDVPLYWQHSAIRSATLQAMARAFVDAAKTRMN